MKVKRSQLLKELHIVEVGIDVKEGVEQSDCFVFTKGRVMTYNDTVACSVACCLKVEGAIKAPKLLDMLNRSNDEEIEFIEDEKKLKYKGKKKRGYFVMQNTITLPFADVTIPTKWKRLPEGFYDAINLVKECAHKSIATHMNCVHFAPNLIEACDSTQAGRCTIDTPFTKTTLLRKNVVKQVADLRLAGVGFTENWVHFHSKKGGLTISCHEVLDQYPTDKLTAIFQNTGEPTVLPSELKDIVKRTEVFLDDVNCLEVKIKGDFLKVTGKGPDGSHTEREKIEHEGKDLTFNINPTLLKELSARNDKCEVSENIIKIEKDDFQYVTTLWVAQPVKE